MGGSKTFDGLTGNILPSVTVSGGGSAVVACSGADSTLALAGNTTLVMSNTAGINTWGGIATAGGELIFQEDSSTGGTGLWVTDRNSSLILPENADAAGSLVRLDDGVLYMGNTNQIGSLVGTTGSQVNSVTPNGAVTLGSDNSTNNGRLVDNANFAGAFTLIDKLTKIGSLTQILSGTGNTVGSVDVTGGTLRFEQDGAFTTTGDFHTKAGGPTDIGLTNSTLAVGGAFTQDAGSVLKVSIGGTPDITADTASLNGQLEINGFVDGPQPVKASEVTNNTYTVIHSTNGITGDFTNNLWVQRVWTIMLHDGYVSVDGKDYNLGFHLAWNEGLQAAGTGNFTLNDGTAFVIDTALAD